MGRANTSSVDSNNGYKLAHLAGQQRAAMKGQFQSKGSESDEQVVNARKAANIALEKEKAKKKAKMAKASRKKNKK